ncbi:hypothetical protein BYT27DRAFT_7249932 [Phlegmacium glaucopus]|nr:hypothetical protein BYT27DRAFT_7249932 [Phlegmacium glaucopus]
MSSDGISAKPHPQHTVPEAASVNSSRDLMDLYCWRICDAELCIRVATDVYILGTANGHYPSTSTCRQTSRSMVWLDLGLESASYVHLRNAMILQTYPSRLYFSSLRTVALSISSYEEPRWIQECQDYSRLKQRCRQKFLQATVTNTLVVKRLLILADLTDEVVIIDDSAAAHGSISDVWKGNWDDPVERRPRVVASKFLRQIMVQNRLRAEVLAWHRLCHRNRNILADEKGYAIMEEMFIKMGTSFFPGSTRWMAPELIMALIHDDGHIPPITTSSDVYAFASVWIATGQLPYPNRTTVTVDILRGIKPLKLDTRAGACCITVGAMHSPVYVRQSYISLDHGDD